MSSERAGDWTCTYTGEAFYPLDPRPEEICIEDIAHALSHQCRFAGHSREFYSVGEHSVRVYCRARALWGSARGRTTVSLAALLHDASEAYLVDLPAPLKRLPHFSAYRDAEERLQKMIYEVFDVRVDRAVEEVVHRADVEMLAAEKAEFMPTLTLRTNLPAREWSHLPEAPVVAGRVGDPAGVKSLFLYVYHQLRAVDRAERAFYGDR